MVQYMITDNISQERPKSPHLQIYRWPITMAASIIHRATGVALYIGTVFLAIWFISLAYNPEFFNYIDGWTHNIIVRFFLFLYSFKINNKLIKIFNLIKLEKLILYLGMEGKIILWENT